MRFACLFFLVSIAANLPLAAEESDAPADPVLRRDIIPVRPDRQQCGRITSYNVCYTKLLREVICVKLGARSVNSAGPFTEPEYMLKGIRISYPFLYRFNTPQGGK